MVWGKLTNSFTTNVLKVRFRTNGSQVVTNTVKQSLTVVNEYYWLWQKYQNQSQKWVITLDPPKWEGWPPYSGIRILWQTEKVLNSFAKHNGGSCLFLDGSFPKAGEVNTHSQFCLLCHGQGQELACRIFGSANEKWIHPWVECQGRAYQLSLSPAPLQAQVATGSRN